MHTDHISLITKAKRGNDAVLVIVSGTNTDHLSGNAGFKNKRLVLGSNTDTFFTNNYQSTIKAIKKHLGFDI